MARSVVRLLTDDEMHARMAAAATRAAHDRYCDTRIVPVYEAYYQEIMRGASDQPRKHENTKPKP